MSHTGWPAAHEYAKVERLARRFVHKEIDGKAFADEFLELRRSILDSQDQRRGVGLSPTMNYWKTNTGVV